MILLDLQKAFDTVDYKILSEKLANVHFDTNSVGHR